MKHQAPELEFEDEESQIKPLTPEEAEAWRKRQPKMSMWRILVLQTLMGGAAAMSLSGVLLPVGHIIAGSIWAIFHILIITLQAFIFMMLTLIYLGQAHEAH